VSGPSPLNLTRETEPLAETVRAIADGLDAYNERFAPGGDWTPRFQVGRDAAGSVQCGIKYFVAFDWLFVNWLWVAEPYRRQGEGARLMEAAEAEARALGCRGAYLDTFGFQAPGFYAKLGYREFGRIADFPPGFDRIWLMKRFA
jgi:GNAT superfamily N-acetyltransferase